MHLRNCSSPIPEGYHYGATCVPEEAFVSRLEHVRPSGWSAVAADVPEPHGNQTAVVLSTTLMPLPPSESGEAPCWVLNSRRGQVDIVLNMTATALTAGVSVSPCPGRTPITVFTMHVSGDGVQWGEAVASGRWVEESTEGDSSAEFQPVQAQYIRISVQVGTGSIALSNIQVHQLRRDGLTEVHGTAPSHTFHPMQASSSSSATSLGKWGSTITFPVLPAGIALLPNGQLVMWSAYQALMYTEASSHVTQTALLNLTTLVSTARTVSNTYHQMFCPGTAMLADGRIQVNGGSTGASSSLFDFNTGSWSPTPWMNVPRGYQAAVTLSNGNVFSIGGSWPSPDITEDKTGELWTVDDGTWTLLPGIPATPIRTADPEGVYRADNHAWLFAMTDGWVLQAGPSKMMHWIDTRGTGHIYPIGLRADDTDKMNGNAVMYDAVKGLILTLGGAKAYDQVKGTFYGSALAYVLDVSAGVNKTITVTRTGSMAFQRAFSNSVVLPDGTVLVVGGQVVPQPFTDSYAILPAELWSPTTGNFTVLASMSVPRTYHSVALLLQDGTVFAGGGGLCGSSCHTNHPNAQIFSPPYLFNSDGSLRSRPAIISAPRSAVAGQILAVTTSVHVASFVLIRYESTTHAVHTDQRRIPLVTPLGVPVLLGWLYTLLTPVSTGVIVPGYYMLFALDSHDTPSVAASLNFTIPVAPFPLPQTGRIRYQSSNFCLSRFSSYSAGNQWVGLWPCDLTSSTQLWQSDPVTATLRDVANSSSCLSVYASSVNSGMPLVMAPCQNIVPQQITYRSSTSHWTVAGLCLSLAGSRTAGPTQASALPAGAPNSFPPTAGLVQTQTCSAGGVDSQQFSALNLPL